ncbi:MAG: hypothetical protein HQM13_09790 [SAR324 cluster bacterium]|nr:hypothetical protein [SAR324 cluster bacterium]
MKYAIMGTDDTLTTLLESWSRKTPRGRAVLDRSADWSYQEIASESKRLACGLKAIGVNSGAHSGKSPSPKSTKDWPDQLFSNQ